jgi:cell division protein FtsW
VTEQRGFDWVLLLVAVLLTALGILMVVSITSIQSLGSTGGIGFTPLRHMINVAIAVVGLIVVAGLNPEMFFKYAVAIFVAGIVVLAAVDIPGIGHSSGGARRWFNLGFMRIQPGEFAKLAFIIYLSRYIAKNEQHMRKLGIGLMIPLFLLIIVCILYLLEPDFGSSAVLMIVSLILLGLVCSASHLAVGALLVATSFVTLILLSPYRMKRVLSFMDPFADSGASGYQLVQSLIALGSGGLFGKGLGGSDQKLFYLPAAQTDFIFAIIGEEFGFVGAVAVILLYVLLFVRGLKIARSVKGNSFYYNLALGCTLLIFIPAVLNIGVVTGLLPTKGLVLPFVSYGGSALLANFLMLGILLRLSSEAPGRGRR